MPVKRLTIATYNVNGIKGRLPVLLRWLVERAPDIACLQEIKTADETFPVQALEEAGYQRHLARPEKLQRRRHSGRGAKPVERLRGLPATRTTPTAATSRPKSWASWSAASTCPTAIRLPDRSSTTSSHGSIVSSTMRERLLKAGGDTILCGDYNAVPTPLDAYKPERWVGDAVFFPNPRSLRPPCRARLDRLPAHAPSG